jgi:hypothetical protein
MKQLIEDLISMMEYHVEQTRPIHTTTVALQAAREALKAMPAPVQEPIGYWPVERDGVYNSRDSVTAYRTPKAGWIPVYTTPPTAPPTTEESSAVKPAAPVQEPDHGDELTIAYMSGLHDGKKKREWVSLTADERYDIRASFRGRFLETSEFAEQVQLATEAKLKEKNT